MRQFNVEIFDRDMNFVCNTVTDNPKVREDYLDPEKYTVDLTGIQSGLGYFIHLLSEKEKYIGIITALEDKKDGEKKLTICEIPSLFDVEMIIDVEDFNYSMENYIKKWIEALFKDGDSEMALPLTVNVSSETLNWSIDYKILNEVEEDEEKPPVTVAKINLFDDVILPAFTQYQIRLDYSIDLTNKKIVIDIGKNVSETIKIESDAKNIIDKSVIIRKSTRQTNKILVYDRENYNNFVTYYLHPDDSYDKNDTDRVSPVSYKILEAKKETEKEGDVEVVTKTFEEAAHEKAGENFSKNKYTNCITLKMISNDELINPSSLKVGQKVSIVSDGIEYASILSGRNVSETTELIFGTIRLELTKMLKGRA